MYAKSVVTIANILAAAQTCFTSKNFADVTMTEIAETAEVTKGALYHHFSGKEELYLKMMYDYLAEIQSLMQSVAEGEGTSREKLHRLALSFFSELSTQRQALMKLVRRDINIFKDPERQELVRAYQAAMPEQAEAIIGEGISEGEIIPGDARLLAWDYTALIEVVFGAYAQQVLGSPEEIAGHVTRLFFDGAGVR